MWGSSAAITISGIITLVYSKTLSLIIHTACQISLASIATSIYTEWFFSVQHSCQMSQQAMVGCDQCPCAREESCNRDTMRQERGCDECLALSYSGCNVFTTMGTSHIILLVVGAVFWACSAMSSATNLALIFYKIRRRRKRVARDVALSLYVDHQTKLLAAGDKPTVTPSHLQSWISELLMSSDIECRNSATLCRMSLKRRGYNMTVIRNWDDLWTSTIALKGLTSVDTISPSSCS